MMIIKNNTYRNVILTTTITSLIAVIMITSGIGVAYAADDTEEFNDATTTATGHNSAAFGYSTTASGSQSAAFGGGTTASGSNSAAFGWETTASGSQSAAFGWETTASGSQSAAFGGETTASGSNSAAFGWETTASGSQSAAFGDHTTAQPYNSFVIGRYNEISGTPASWVNDDPLFVIGNGDLTTPHNAVTVLKNGNVGIGESNPTADLQILGTANTNAIIWDNGSGALRHHWDALTWDRQTFNILIDADNDDNVAKFQIEKSEDGIIFEEIGSVLRNKENRYSFYDNETNTAYYRIKM
ncbi:hypothetical protein LCGC14_2207820, partial [marine sediment metagenome]